ncbi:MAG: hypothetical protein ACLFS7_01275 [Desulfosudaceae bacterium]
MKYFPLKIAALLIIITPLLFFATVFGLQFLAETRYAREIENRYLGDTEPLFEGEVRLREAVNNNIDEYLQDRLLLRLGARVDATVTAGQNIVIYPASPDSSEDVIKPPLSNEIAAENYRLMSRGLSVSVRTLFPWNSLLVIFIFIGYLLAALVVFSRFYVAGAARAREEAREKSRELERLKELEREHAERLSSLNSEKRRLASEMVAVRNNLLEHREKASQNEDAMIDEIIELEEKIHQNIKLREALREENESLRQTARRFEDEKRKRSNREAIYGNLEKRFKTLYKNVALHERALDNFFDLTDDMRIKAEEVIKQLDTDTALVDIKRKVDLKKGREKVFEIIFSYNGRLYFRNRNDGRVEVLTIGTKNSQSRDLSFLNNL